MPSVEISQKRPGRVDIATNFVDRFLIKELPGANWDGEVWHAPCTWATCVILRGLFGDQLEIGPQLLEWSWQEYKNRVEPTMKLRLALKIPDEFLDTPAARVILSWRGTRTKPNGDPLDLKEFQEAGILFLYYAVSAGIGDPMGSGKTTQLIHLLMLLDELGEDPFPSLVVTPNGVKKTWSREFAMWFPKADVQIIAENADRRREQLSTPADVYIINWDALRLHSRLASYGAYALRGCRVCDKSLLQIHDDALARLNDLKEQIKANEEADEPDPLLAEALNQQLPIVDKAYKDAKRNSEHRTCEKCPRELNAVEWRTVIADEAHRARNPKSKQTRALWATSKPANRRPWATGTPINDTIDGLWSPLHFMAPDEWPAKTRYLDRFAELSFNVFGGMNVLGIKDVNREEFFKIFDPRFRRLPKELILPQLPPKISMPPYVTEMSPKQAKAYKQMLKHMMTELDDGTLLTAPNPLVRTIRLLQFASAFAEVGEDGHVVMGLPSCKVDLLEELVCDGGDLEGEQVVFFAESEKLIRLCAQRLDKMKVPFGLITGPTSLELRDLNERAFQSGDLQVILATMGAGREGITLTAAPVLVRLQRSYRPEFNQQSEDRVHRIGSEIHEYVRIIDAVTPDTIEIGQIAVLMGKYGRQQEVNRDKETLRKILNGEGEIPDELILSAA